MTTTTTMLRRRSELQSRGRVLAGWLMLALSTSACSEVPPFWTVPTSVTVDVEDVAPLAPGRETLDDDVDPPMFGCWYACDTAADCVPHPPVGDAVDEDNWSCIDGVCRSLGCHPGECEVGGRSTCARSRVRPVRECLVTCSSNADCTGQYSTYGRHECAAGVCQPVGCRDSGECQSHFGPHVACLRGRIAGIRECREPCEFSSDCAPNVFFEENECRDGVCRLPQCKPEEPCDDDPRGKARTCVQVR